MKNGIFLEDWLVLKPYKRQTSTDSYYIGLCNKVKKLILSDGRDKLIAVYLDQEDINNLACFLTSYLEDLVSDTNIWNSFVRVHLRLYGKQLPFYSFEDYYEEEINVQDLCLLVWYFISTMEEEAFISPFSDLIFDIANSVMVLFEEIWEYAPENKHLKKCYQIDDNESDFYKVRELINSVLSQSYLFYPDVIPKWGIQENEIIESVPDIKDASMYLYENRDHNLHRMRTQLLGLMGKEWVAEILGNEHPLYAAILNISDRIEGLFFYKGQDKLDIFIVHIASGKRFKLTKKSFDHPELLHEIDMILRMGIIRWKNEWWFTGILMTEKYNTDLILDEKKSLHSRKMVDFLDCEDEKVQKHLQLQLEAFKKFTGGSQITFLPADQIEPFIKSYYVFLNQSLNLSRSEIDEAKQRVRQDGFTGSEEISIDFTEIAESGLVFFNPEGGIEIAINMNNAFPIANNVYFNEFDEDDAIFVLKSEQFSKELAMFCIDHSKDLPFFKIGFGKLFLDNLDFLMRFWKKASYFSKPQITTVG